MIKQTLLLAGLTVCMATTQAIAPVQAATWEYQGTASTGEKVSLNLDSIEVSLMSLRRTQFSYFFDYQIGEDRIYALTDCDGQFQTSKDGDRWDGFIKPQSTATAQMLDRVCTYRKRQARVIDPPSNVRFGPSTEDRLVCSIETSRRITTYGSRDGWFYTDACGKLGLIHGSQIRSL